MFKILQAIVLLILVSGSYSKFQHGNAIDSGKEKRQDNLIAEEARDDQHVQHTEPPMLLKQIARPSSWCPANIGNGSSCFDLTPSGYGCVCFVEKFMPFPVAQANCQINGMHLVALETEGKRQFLFQLKKDKNIDNFPYLNWWWTSGSDLDEEGHWKWTSTGEPFSFIPWVAPSAFTNPDGWRFENHLAIDNPTFSFWDWPMTMFAFSICENP